MRSAGKDGEQILRDFAWLAAFDAIAENAEGARRVGMASINFRDIDGLRAELRRYPELPLP